MRVPALIIALLAVSLVTSACAGGPEDADKRLAEACERQIEEGHEEESGVPVAKSTEERLEQETLVECAGQEKVVAADDEHGKDADAGAGTDKDGHEPAEDPGSGGDEAEPAELDPQAREQFAATCGSCHELSDAETTGMVGPSLDDTSLDSTGVLQKIQEGGGGMPAGLLEGEDAENVADYVAAAAAAE